MWRFLCVQYWWRMDMDGMVVSNRPILPARMQPGCISEEPRNNATTNGVNVSLAWHDLHLEFLE